MSVRVRILFFGQLKDLIGKSEESQEITPGTTLSELLVDYGTRFPKFQLLAASIACSVNQEYASAATVLNNGDEIGFLPPVSGGSGGTSQKQRCGIVRGAIPTQEIADSMKVGEDGAVVIFEGIVRNHTRNRRTLHLEYEAYMPMAVNQLEILAKEVLDKFTVRDLRIVHRLGRLEIGETSVLIVVAAAHRGAAFEACRWLIDTLKKTVPIWKREYFEDGAVWADGEAFPEEIRAAK